MICRDLMPRSHDPALEQTERGLNSVRRNVAVNIDAILVADGTMPLARVSSPIQGEGAGSELIRHNHVYIAAYVIADVLRKCAGLAILGVEEAKFSTALLDSKDDFLIGSASKMPRRRPPT